jgi:hypothetical protein
VHELHEATIALGQMLYFLGQFIYLLLKRSPVWSFAANAKRSMALVFGLVAAVAKRATVADIEAEFGVNRFRLDVMGVKVVDGSAVHALAIAGFDGSGPLDHSNRRHTFASLCGCNAGILTRKCAT